MDNNVKTYYLDLTLQQFLAGKELLKSMPLFFNTVYFCKKYANALWNGMTNEVYHDIAMIIKKSDIDRARQVIKNNGLHISNWDSLKYTSKGDFGFSFIAGNIKYIVMPFEEIESGYMIYSYDVNTMECTTTTINANKNLFLDVSVTENAEFVRTCDFNIEDINESNSSKFVAEKKQPAMAVYNSNSGKVNMNIPIFLIVIGLSALTVYIALTVIRLA